ncbi:ABC transporter substrate-binding protein [Arthrobacter sulfonylureivorans]|uniref:ABC transporter substrate-binding protein n=1 Tax=Arthrobacter sulfonylureivorans TaxID=2486855 RepID=A0ABY3WCL3_9MICC|nr:ABC transporter substrate-binding protein [Arthrobacter sulfonylureivorans]UNK47751.1 ABC transporter substrate-binding protein [Arthrobacter sulfonylureivorans]
MKKAVLGAIALTAAAALGLVGCGTAASGSADGSGGPIVVGSINSLSGAITFPESSAAAAAVFKAFNEAGGLNGRKIDYRVLDDKLDPGTATASAREAVGGDNAVAMVGSASMIECELNAAYYAQQGILSIPGTGVDKGCFENKNISPVNPGPFNDLALSLNYGSKVLGLKDTCVMVAIAGSSRPSYEKVIADWQANTGAKPLLVDYTLPYGASDYTPYIVKAKKAGCTSISINLTEPDGAAMAKAADSQGWTDVTWLGLPSMYSANFAKAVSKIGSGMYMPVAFYPFTSDNEINADWRKLMTENNVPLTSFSQGGYLAAKYFLEILKTIPGDITRDSVTQAIRDAQPIANPMAGQPYKFGQIPLSGWPIVLKSGTNEWANASDNWFHLS